MEGTRLHHCCLTSCNVDLQVAASVCTVGRVGIGGGRRGEEGRGGEMRRERGGGHQFISAPITTAITIAVIMLVTFISMTCFCVYFFDQLSQLCLLPSLPCLFSSLIFLLFLPHSKRVYLSVFLFFSTGVNTKQHRVDSFSFTTTLRFCLVTTATTVHNLSVCRPSIFLNVEAK